MEDKPDTKDIEKSLIALFLEFQKEYPSLHNLSFEAATYGDSGRKPRFFGYYHIGNDCKTWESLDEIRKLIDEAKERRKHNAILYQSFEGVL